MVRIKLLLDKSIEENASVYYNNAKKFKKKKEGANIAIEIAKKKLEKLQKTAKKEDDKEEITKEIRKKEWYEKFRWFISSEGYLAIGGRDATTNEIIIKKHTEKNDIILHTDMAGSPFFVIKVGKDKIDPIKIIQTIKETASATASYSKAWKLGVAAIDVFYVLPDQVSKEAQSGEYLSKGSFMIRGKTTYVDAEIRLAIGVKDDVIIGGPVDAIKKQTKDYVIVTQGTDKPSDTAKKIKKVLKTGNLDEIIRFLPSGNCKINSN